MADKWDSYPYILVYEVFGEEIDCPDDIEDSVEWALQCIDNTDAYVLRARLRDGRTYTDIGKSLGVGKDRIRQRESRGLVSLRRSARARRVLSFGLKELDIQYEKMPEIDASAYPYNLYNAGIQGLYSGYPDNLEKSLQMILSYCPDIVVKALELRYKHKLKIEEIARRLNEDEDRLKEEMRKALKNLAEPQYRYLMDRDAQIEGKEMLGWGLSDGCLSDLWRLKIASRDYFKWIYAEDLEHLICSKSKDKQILIQNMQLWKRKQSESERLGNIHKIVKRVMELNRNIVFNGKLTVLLCEKAKPFKLEKYVLDKETYIKYRINNYKLRAYSVEELIEDTLQDYKRSHVKKKDSDMVAGREVKAKIDILRMSCPAVCRADNKFAGLPDRIKNALQRNKITNSWVLSNMRREELLFLEGIGYGLVDKLGIIN